VKLSTKDVNAKVVRPENIIQLGAPFCVRHVPPPPPAELGSDDVIIFSFNNMIPADFHAAQKLVLEFSPA